jgi:hypothetical protein
VKGEVQEISQAELLLSVGTKEDLVVGLLFETEVWEDQTLPLRVEATPSGLHVECRLSVGRHK